jgi:hypothetical protein
VFKIGQKVVCIKDYSLHKRRNRRVDYPFKGQVYTVRAYCRTGLSDGILLKEISNVPIFVGSLRLGEPSFCPKNFRPLIETKNETFFTQGADPESEKWDNCRHVGVPV